LRIYFMAPMLIFLIIFSFMLVKLVDSANKKPSPLIGRTLPVFNLEAAYEGASGLVSSEIKGQYALINVFGSWCVTCRLEHQFLMQLKERNILPVYGIAWRDSPENLTKFLAQNGNPYTKTGNDFTGEIIIDLGVTGAPETFLVAPEGIIVAAHSGPISEDVWNAEFAPFIAGGKK